MFKCIFTESLTKIFSFPANKSCFRSTNDSFNKAAIELAHKHCSYVL